MPLRLRAPSSVTYQVSGIGPEQYYTSDPAVLISSLSTLTHSQLQNIDMLTVRAQYMALKRQTVNDDA